MSTRGCRSVRAVAAATGTTCAALWMHLLAGASVPAGGGVFVAWLLTLGVCLALVGTRLSLPRLTGAVGCGQIVFHALFTTAASHGGAGAGGRHGVTTSHMAVAVDTAVRHGGSATAGVPGTIPVAPEIPVALHLTPGMVLAHALAVAVTVVLLHAGERAVFALVDALMRLAMAFAPCLAYLGLHLRVLTGRRRVPHPTTFFLPRRLEWHPALVRRRGPPAAMSPTLALAA